VVSRPTNRLSYGAASVTTYLTHNLQSELFLKRLSTKILCIFIFHHSHQPCGIHADFYKLIVGTWALSSKLKRPEREAHHSVLSREGLNSWSLETTFKGQSDQVMVHALVRTHRPWHARLLDFLLVDTFPSYHEGNGLAMRLQVSSSSIRSRDWVFAGGWDLTDRIVTEKISYVDAESKTRQCEEFQIKNESLPQIIWGLSLHNFITAPSTRNKI
jgi:hypothetical protein